MRTICLLFVSLAAAGCLSAPASVPLDHLRRLSVSGQGEVRAVPDMAVLHVGVETIDRSARTAFGQNRDRVGRVIAAVRESGIADTEIQTSHLSVWPRYSADKFVGHVVSNGVTATLHDVSKAGDLLDRVVDVGANRIDGISFGFSDPESLRTQAREKALADARVRAERMAQAAGVRLGRILSIDDHSTVGWGQAALSSAGYGGEYRRTPIHPGEEAVSVTVQVAYEIE